jgi:hypothetical protein
LPSHLLLLVVQARNKVTSRWMVIIHSSTGRTTAKQQVSGCKLRPRFIVAKLNTDNFSLTAEKPTATTKGTTTGKNTATATTSDSESDSSEATESGSPSGSQSAGKSKVTGTKTSGGSVKGGDNSTSTDFDPRLPAGGVQMVTPAPISGAQYYKVGDFVTFAWNYTSLEVTPSAVDILATCTANQATYTLAVNQTVQETGMVIWDTGEFQKTATIPLLTETYTLIIYDAESSVSATAKAGYLAPYKQFQFGMYTPKAYTPFSGMLSAIFKRSVLFHES